MATGGYATQLQGAVYGQTAVVSVLPYTVVDNDQIVNVSSAGAGAVNLPQINGTPSNVDRQLTVFNLGAGTVTLTPFAGDTINGAATYVLTTNQGVRLSGRTLTDWLGTITATPAGLATTLASARLGNVLTVDKVNGNNATATRGGLPFATITAALAAALAGDAVWVLPGTYTEAIVIPASVSVVGLSRARCIIDRTAIGVATDIVTLNANASITGMTITGSTSAAVQLRGVVFATGSTEQTARCFNCTIVVDHTGAGTGVGVQFTGGGTPNSDFTCLLDSSILVTGSGAQIRRGLYVSGGGSSPIVENCLVRVGRAGGAVGTYYGCEQSGTGTITLRDGSYEGPSGAGGADVSQSTGTLVLDNALLLTVNANGLGFTAPAGVWSEWSGDTGIPTVGATRFFRSGTTTAQATEVTHTTRSPRVARAIVVTSRVAPGGGQNCAFTLRKNGVNTAVTVTLTNNQTTGTLEAASVGYVAGDNYSVQCVQSAGSALADVQVGIEWYVG